jgi:GntR family transcriptional regulator
MLHIQINPQSGLPVYRQVMDQIRYYAASGVLRPGGQLPSIRELARSLAVNPATIVKAYTELEHEGLVEMKQGKGAFRASSGPAMSASAVRGALAGAARALAVQAAQLGAAPEAVLDAVRDEMERLRHERTGD